MLEIYEKSIKHCNSALKIFQPKIPTDIPKSAQICHAKKLGRPDETLSVRILTHFGMLLADDVKFHHHNASQCMMMITLCSSNSSSGEGQRAPSIINSREVIVWIVKWPVFNISFSKWIIAKIYCSQTGSDEPLWAVNHLITSNEQHLSHCKFHHTKKQTISLSCLIALS